VKIFQQQAAGFQGFAFGYNTVNDFAGLLVDGLESEARTAE
jgi:hypothetical protein